MAKYTDNTDATLAAIERLANEKLEIAAQMIERTAKKVYVPVKTGTLKRSITHIIKKLTAFIGSNLNYATHIEMGTTKQEAQPYLLPSLMANLQKIKKLFEAK